MSDVVSPAMASRHSSRSSRRVCGACTSLLSWLRLLMNETPRVMGDLPSPGAETPALAAPGTGGTGA